MSWIRYAFATIILIGLGCCSSEQCHQASIVVEYSLPSMKRQHLPTTCRDLMTKPDPSKWNPGSETYETTGEWAECMGVEKKMYRRDM